jgi:hypothetical protein
MASDDKKQELPQSGPVEWFERIALLGKDFRKIVGAAFVPGVLVVLVFLFLPAAADHLANPEQAFYQACIRTFPLTLTIAIIWVTLRFWLQSGDAFTLYWLISIWAVSILFSINLASHFGCADCGTYEDIQAMEIAWVPGFIRNHGGDSLGLLLTAPVYFFKLFGPAGFVAALICGSFIGLAGIFLLRPGGPLSARLKKEP